MTTNDMRNKYVPSTKKIDGISIILTLLFSSIIGAMIGTIVAIAIFYFSGDWFVFTTITLSIITVTISFFIYLLSNIQQVSEGYIWIVQFWGGYMTTWSGGGHMYFNLFDWIKLRAEIFLGEETIELFPDSKDLIDLDDASCHLKASVVVKVVHPLLSVYNIGNYKEAVRGRVAGLLRSHLSKYTLDEANEKKSAIDFKAIILFGKDDEIKEGNYKDGDFFAEVRNDWGVDLLKLIVADFELSAADIIKRERKQDAAIAKQVALDNKDIEITASEGKAKAIENIAKAKQVELAAEGLGVAEQIEALVKSGMTVEAATNLISDRYKWSKIGDKALIIESGNGSVAGDGAKFGAGMEKGKNTSNEPKV